MIGSLISICVAVYLWFHSYLIEIMVNRPTLITMMSVLAFAFLFYGPVALLASWLPLQASEQNSTPRIIEMFRRDKFRMFLNAWLILFFFITLVIIFGILSKRSWYSDFVMLAWIVLLGITVDIGGHFLSRIMSYFDPFSAIKLFTKEAKECIQNNRELELCHWIDALCEVALKGVERQSTATTNLALVELRKSAALFLEASKSISHAERDKETEILGIKDKVSYTMFYLYQRLDMIFDRALSKKNEPVCSHLINLMGKITIDAAKYDISLASIPLRFLGKFARKSQEEKLEEASITASCLFSEIAKVIINEIDITYLEIRDPFLSIINGMEVQVKEAFRQDKTMNLNLLIQPFKDLRLVFENGKAKEHQDTPIILQNIDRVIGEFEALKMVMNTIPTFSTAQEQINPSMPPSSANS